MSEAREVKIVAQIQTSAELAFEAVTCASELREWFCDSAQTEVKPGGRYAVGWERGYHADGQFTDIDAPHRAALSWRGLGDPGMTSLVFTIEPIGEAVLVTAVHRGFLSGDRWDRALAEAEKGWSTGLENLKSVLESGVDLRLARQPFLGVIPDLVDAEQASETGVAAEIGIFVSGTVENSGADAAGLLKGDRLLTLGGTELGDLEELAAAVRAQRAGDVVDVVLVRGQVQLTIPVVLGSRPRQKVPDRPETLAQAVSDRHKEVNSALEAAVSGLTEEDAAAHPLEDEWSVREVLAHLYINERDFHTLLPIMALDGWFEEGGSNPSVMPARIAAAVECTPTAQGLLERFVQEEAEMESFLRNLPDETVAHKGRFRRIGELALGLAYHTYEHVEQIRSIASAAQG